jgi:WD40 repeat protein
MNEISHTHPLCSCSLHREVVSGGNDADVRYYEIEKKVCTVYQHHSKKVLRLSVNPVSPDTFLTCSADGISLCLVTL